MWEYRFEHIRFGDLSSAVQRKGAKRQMDALGKDGWEAVSIVGSFPSGVEVLFKRYTQEYLDSQQRTFSECIADGLVLQDMLEANQ